MRRYWRERPPTSVFRGAEFPRLMIAISMLVVLYMIIVRARDENTWRWLAKFDGSSAKHSKSLAAAGESRKPESESKLAVVPETTGPTDEDPDQAESAREEFQVVVDGSLKVQREEMEIYDRMVEWVKNQSFARLQHRAKEGVRYTHLYDDAEKHRGELVSLNLDILIADAAGKNRFGIPLHDAWATSAEEPIDRLYSLIVVDYPKEMPVGYKIHAKAKFAGYFLKLQGYHPAMSKPGAKPEMAPLLIGRLEWHPSPVAALPIDNSKEWIFGLGLLAAIAAAMAVRWIYLKWIRPPRKSSVGSTIGYAAPGEVISIDQWLDQGNFSDGENDREPGNRV